MKTSWQKIMKRYKILPVEKKRKLSTGMTPMSLYGDSKVKLRTTNPMAAFWIKDKCLFNLSQICQAMNFLSTCMAVSKEMAITWALVCLKWNPVDIILFPHLQDRDNEMNRWDKHWIHNIALWWMKRKSYFFQIMKIHSIDETWRL